MKTKDVYFGRHGESRAKATRIHEGGDSPLTERGVLQAEFSAIRLRKKGIERIITSNYARAIATAEVHGYHLGLPVANTSHLFAERRNPSVMLGKHADVDEIERIQDEIAAHYGVPGWHHSDEENFEELLARAKDALAFLESVPEDTIYVASHGMFMKVIFAYVQLGGLLTGRIFWDRYVPMKNVHNTGLMHLQHTMNYFGTGMYWKLVSWNDHAHLENMEY
jgi:broad specificity phosphatase PhoE